jgi:hypothetical protein
MVSIEGVNTPAKVLNLLDCFIYKKISAKIQDFLYDKVLNFIELKGMRKNKCKFKLISEEPYQSTIIVTINRFHSYVVAKIFVALGEKIQYSYVVAVI